MKSKKIRRTKTNREKTIFEQTKHEQNTLKKAS